MLDKTSELEGRHEEIFLKQRLKDKVSELPVSGCTCKEFGSGRFILNNWKIDQTKKSTILLEFLGK